MIKRLYAEFQRKHRDISFKLPPSIDRLVSSAPRKTLVAP
jgi:hypothetical protein